MNLNLVGLHPGEEVGENRRPRGQDIAVHHELPTKNGTCSKLYEQICLLRRDKFYLLRTLEDMVIYSKSTSNSKFICKIGH